MADPTAFSRRAAVSAVLIAVTRPARAAWPERPVRLVIPFGGGGQTDIVSRLIGEALAQRLGQTVLADNRPGAAGNLAAEIVARAPADGYTILIGSTGTIGGVNQALYRSLAYDTVRDFAAVASAPIRRSRTRRRNSPPSCASAARFGAASSAGWD
jgi:tripartite-type tricarboxylate transporter receptor subunit TctC